MRAEKLVFRALIVTGLVVIFVLGGIFTPPAHPWTYYLSFLASVIALVIGIVGTLKIHSMNGGKNQIDSRVIALAALGYVLGYVAVSSLVYTFLILLSAFSYWWVHLLMSGILLACGIILILHLRTRRIINHD